MSKISEVLQNTVNAFVVGREIYQTTVNAMDAAEKEKQSGADKKVLGIGICEVIYSRHWRKLGALGKSDYFIY